jgi:serine/threonine-protein kinase HipA
VAPAALRAAWGHDVNDCDRRRRRKIGTTNDLDLGTCSIDLLEAAAEYIGLGLAPARAIIKEVATVTAR